MAENLRAVLEGIRRKLQSDVYQNEEHVRLSLVARVLYALDWDIWNPAEVNAEYCPVPKEDRTKVDIAILLSTGKPAAFMEIKSVGRLEVDLERTEGQVRDYNRNNSATFCILTDGQFWRFYYSLTAGNFSDKCFWRFDISTDSLDDIGINLLRFLAKDDVCQGKYRKEAESELDKSEKQRVLESLVPQAIRKAEDTGEGAVQIIMRMAKEEGYTLDQIRAQNLYQLYRSRMREDPSSQGTGIKEKDKNILIGHVRNKKPRIEGKISQNQLVLEVVKSLQRLGGRAHKNLVEEDIYKRYIDVFCEEFYQRRLENGAIKWKNMIEWARNTAKDQGLIKPPVLGQRGIWELTDKGRKFR